MATTPVGPFSNLSPALTIPGVGQVTTNYIQVNGGTNTAAYYRIEYTP